MDYYSCQMGELLQENKRRGYIRFGTHDQLSERLSQDDDERGTDATAVTTEHLGAFVVSRELPLPRSAEFGASSPASQLVGEKIIYWTLNTFFPTFQLSFESGLSCTIDSGSSSSQNLLRDATVGLDANLRFRLTDCSHDEDGRLVKSLLPEKFASSGTGLVIREVCVGRRTSVAVKPVVVVEEEVLRADNTAHTFSPPPPNRTSAAAIVHEVHTVIGLRLQGMSEMGYIWAKAPPSLCSSGSSSGGEDRSRTWGDVRLTGLRNDVPCPFLGGYPGGTLKPGGQVDVVVKESLISKGASARDDGVEWGVEIDEDDGGGWPP